MNIDDLLNYDFGVNILSIVDKIKSREGIVHVGSRSVLTNLPESTDWDFMCADTPENFGYLSTYFDLDVNCFEYMDACTCGVWHHKLTPSIQVVTKNPEDFDK